MYAPSAVCYYQVSDNFLASAKRVMSLQEPTLKMSKSHADSRSRIIINDSPAAIEEKIRLALTDSTAGVSYDPTNRPGVSNLLALMKHLDPESWSFEELSEKYSALTMRDFKKIVADTISVSLGDIRARYNQLMNDGTGSLEDIARKGAESARGRADETMKSVRCAVGL